MRREQKQQAAPEGPRYVKPPRPRIVTMPDGSRDYAYVCPHCQDTGIVSIFGGKSLALTRQGKLAEARNLETYSVKCVCEYGQSLKLDAISYQPIGHARYSCIPAEADKELLRVTGSDDARLARYGAKNFADQF